MCEWLSRGDWCDVQLLCGGRAFSAHRAVLASVSTFLKRILLSCPTDDTAFIVLPDFDLEAMSSVLFYIYNGEVIMQKQKVGLFLDIIQTMQIHIDHQYLPKMKKDEEDKYFVFDDYEASSMDIYTLGLSNDNEHIFNIKRCKESLQALLKYSQSDSDFQDKSVRCRNESELGKSRLGNLKSPYESRQKNFLLRDLYIETYPRNGNANGLTESVLAISNECYLSPGSVLLANANCRHLGNDEARTPLGRQRTEPIHASAVDKDSHIYNCNQECPHTSVSADLRFYKSANEEATSMIYERSAKFSKVNKTNDETPSQHKLNIFDINTLVSNSFEGSNNNNHLLLDDATKLGQNMRMKMDLRSKSSTKVIFNHVLESPWNARKPNNYRPFRRKNEATDHPQTIADHTTVVSDKNNNLQEVISPSKQNNETIVDIVSTDSPVVENTECFKCTHCDQVFTTGESLAVHMRRHSTNARYTCGECGKTFSQLRNFKYHMSIHRGTREFAATCTVCGKYFNDRGYLSSHMKIHRNRKEYKCSLCPKSFNQRVAYNMHVRIHTGIKPHVCEQCGKAFSRKMLLKQHQRTHSGERPYACPHCDKRFADRSNMTLHLRLHTGVKPFSCPMCPKSFTKKHHLKSHLNFHTGSKPYSCPRCSLAFTQSSNMRTHFKKCTAEPSTTNETSLILPLYGEVGEYNENK